MHTCLCVSAGLFVCAQLPEDCGTGEGATCCPSTWRLAANPPVNPDCQGEDMFCNYGDPKATEFPGHEGQAFKPGVCYRNKPDCGEGGGCLCDGCAPAPARRQAAPVTAHAQHSHTSHTTPDCLCVCRAPVLQASLARRVASAMAVQAAP